MLIKVSEAIFLNYASKEVNYDSYMGGHLKPFNNLSILE